ncbi:MAG TPA: hypothetical protein GX707_05880 [Epulopiscium sp.]|nr:hypothetical protein [Candidatus Epulonipiscium sp.]
MVGTIDTIGVVNLIGKDVDTNMDMAMNAADANLATKIVVVAVEIGTSKITLIYF